MADKRSGPPSRSGSKGGFSRGSSSSRGSSRGGFGGGAGRSGPPRGGRPSGGAGRGGFGGKPSFRSDDRSERSSFSDRPKRDFGDRAPRGDRPFSDRPKRDFGDRPRSDRSFGDRPKRDFGDRPKRDFNDRPRRDFGDERPARKSREEKFDNDFDGAPVERARHSYKREGFGASRHFDDKKKSAPRGGRTFEQREERPSRGVRGDDRPKRDFGDRPRSDRSFSDRPKRDFGDERPARRAGFEKRPDADGENAAGAMKGHEMMLYGVHAVQAALRNPNRIVKTIWVSENGKDHLEGAYDEARHPAFKEVEKRDITARLPEGAVHQGIAIAVEPLADVFLSDVISAAMAPSAARQVVVVLDEVSDPHNVGAVMRSMSAFGATALIVHKRNAPGMTGVMAKIATGAIEHVPMVPVTNLAKALQELQMAGFYCLGLDERADFPIQKAPKDKHIALVLGAEGDGLRDKTRSTCDAIATIETFGDIQSLNVSNAAAIALYALTAK